MVDKIKQNVMNFLSSFKDDRAKTQTILTFLQQNINVFPKGQAGIDKACFILAHILEKNPKLLNELEKNQKRLDELQKNLGLGLSKGKAPKSSGP